MILQNLMLKIFQKALEKQYPDREFAVEKIGKQLAIMRHDRLGTSIYSLKGKHPYSEVIRLNDKTGFSAYLGYNTELGPVAIIGVPNGNMDFQFFGDVEEYGSDKQKEYEFSRFNDGAAEQIGNYTIFVFSNSKGLMEEIENGNYQFEKICSTSDARYFLAYESHDKRVLKMMAKLKGTYSFKKAEKLSKSQQRYAGDRGMAYATLDDGRHVAIRSFWYDKKDEVIGFREPWQKNQDEPKVHDITFLTDEEAASINDFSIYLLDYSLYYNHTVNPEEESIDRTLEPGFNFFDTPDGKDIRITGNY